MSSIAKIMIYDCEIKKAILGRNGIHSPGVEYCEGWHDFKGMGVSVIGVYDYEDERYRIFMDDNYNEFNQMVNDYDIVVGFNSMAFDNKLCEANEIAFSNEKTYDLIVEMWAAMGLGPVYDYKTHGGLSLDATCVANFGHGKSNSGANAPIMYQRRQYGALIDYCLDDIRWTKRLFDRVLLDGFLITPKNQSTILRMRSPF